jgi:hypothetical protein
MKILKILMSLIVFTSLMTFSSCDDDDPVSGITDLQSYLTAYTWELYDADFNTLEGDVVFDNKGIYTLTRINGYISTYTYVIDIDENITITGNEGTMIYHVTWDKNSKEMRWDGVSTNFMHLRYVVK